MAYYHMTRENVAHSILEQGLKGGHGKNGTAIEYSEVPKVYLSEEPFYDFERYGRSCIIIWLSEEELKELGGYQVGQTGTWVIKGNVADEDKVLIPPAHLTEAWREFETGNCEPSKWCTFDCPQHEECELIEMCPYCYKPQVEAGDLETCDCEKMKS